VKNAVIISFVLCLCLLFGCLGIGAPPVPSTGAINSRAISTAFEIPGNGLISQPSSADTISLYGSDADFKTNVTIACTNSSGSYLRETLYLNRSNYVYNLSAMPELSNQTLYFAASGFSSNGYNMYANTTDVNTTATNTTAVANANSSQIYYLENKVMPSNYNFTYGVSFIGNGSNTSTASPNMTNANTSVNLTLNPHWINSSQFNATLTVEYESDASVLTNLTVGKYIVNLTNSSPDTFTFDQTNLTTITSILFNSSANGTNITRVNLTYTFAPQITMTIGSYSTILSNTSPQVISISQSNLNSTTYAIFSSDATNRNITNTSIRYMVRYNPCANFTNLVNVTMVSGNLTMPLTLSNSSNYNSTYRNGTAYVQILADQTLSTINTTGNTSWAELWYLNGSTLYKVNGSGLYSYANAHLEFITTAVNLTSCMNATINTTSENTFQALNYSISGGRLIPPQANSTMVCTTLRRITTDRASNAIVARQNNKSGKFLSTVPYGETDVFNGMQTNGKSQIIPNVTWNTSAVDVRFTSARTLYVVNSNISNVNFSAYYQVSPDGVSWVNGSTVIANLTNDSLAYALNETTNFIRLVLYDGTPNKPDTPYFVIDAN